MRGRDKVWLGCLGYGLAIGYIETCCWGQSYQAEVMGSRHLKVRPWGFDDGTLTMKPRCGTATPHESP